MSESTRSPFCICTSVTRKALDTLLENGVDGAYRDEHPWFAARELMLVERQSGRRLALLLAVEDRGQDMVLSHWAMIENIDVETLHRGAWLTRVSFVGLAPVNPIWHALDSVMLKPGDDQLRREALEPIRQHRQVLDARHAHPYAVCETPAFILTE